MVDSPTRSRRFHNNAGSIATGRRDIAEERYKRPRKVRFYVNGDRYFKGKKLYITPHRYLNFTDLLNDLTGKLPNTTNLPYGVRQIFTTDGGKRVTDIEHLKSGEAYVCAGFESFKPITYGREELERWSLSTGRVPPTHDTIGQSEDSITNSYRLRGFYGNNAFHPGRYLHGAGVQRRRWAGAFGSSVRGSYNLGQSEVNPYKPKVITVVRNGAKPRQNVKILLNRRSVQSYEQLVADISDAFGPKWKSNKLRKLFTIKGREVQSVSDFFRDDDIFVGVGSDTLTESDVQDILEELYPESQHSQSLLKDWGKHHKRRQQFLASKDAAEDSKRDSGFGDISEEGNTNKESETSVDFVFYKGSPRLDDYQRGSRRRNDPIPVPRDQELGRRLDREKDKAAQDERDRAHKRQQKMLESERRALEEERRKHGLIPLKPIDDPFKRFRDQKLREREEARRHNEEQLQRQKDAALREVPEQDKLQDAENRARERQRLALEAAKLTDDQSSIGANIDNNKENESEKKVITSKDIDINKNKVSNKDVKRKYKNKVVIHKSKLERLINCDSEVLEKFELGRVLGDGNFAIVKQVKTKITNQEYALKIIDKPKLKGKEQMVENEIAVMKDCNHVNIVKLYEEYETKDKIYLLMELVKGGDLFDAITQSVKFSEEDAVHMVKDLVSALFYLHSRGIVHRDLKPENLLVCRSKDNSISLKLADFGLAMEVTNLIYTVCGTPTYVAPEILSETGYGLEVDMWAVGVITYILLCGFPPFRSPDRNQTELFELIKAGQYEFLSPYWDHVSNSAKDLIRHLLLVKKQKRYTAIDTLSHPWIIANGRSVIMPMDKAKLEDLRKDVRKELEEQAQQNKESYMNMKNMRA